MNNRKPGRDFSGDKKKAPYKGSFKRKDEASSDRPRKSFDKDSSDKPRRSFSKDGGEKSSDSYRNDKPRRSFDKDSSDKPRRNFSKDREEKSFDKPRRSFDKDTSEKPRRSSDNYRNDKDKDSLGEDKFKKRSDSYRNEGGEKRRYPEKTFNRPSKSFSKDKIERGSDKPRRNSDSYRNEGDDSEKGKAPFKQDPAEKRSERKDKYFKKDFSKKKEKKVEKPTYADQGLTRLNKYISNAGICSRREADDLIKSGCVTVNGKAVTELGFKVKAGDVVNYSGATLKTEKPVYLLLNKPKDYITTADDERGRRTVMELLQGACKERIYPVGRLDRNTTGLLLFTNDGEMTKKLTHPKHMVQKLYHVELDKNLKQTDLIAIRKGVELEDGLITPDEVSYVGETKREVGIEIHSGANRVVRRIFESLGYEVLRLDRVMLAGLTKKNLPKGRWRFLTEQEISFLKMV
jgi:23S rRNA pseudouridine2605 synthase